jgi:RNA polymerase sigma factor (sigma-70 family)
MTVSCDDDNEVLGQYRAYLETLKAIYVNPSLHRYFGMSDIIQNTMLEVMRDLPRIKSMDDAGRKRWLRTMFDNNLKDEIRKIPAQTIVSLDALTGAAGESWRGLKELVAEGTSPSERLANIEVGQRLLEALSKLDPRQREALVLQKYHGWKLAEIAEHMGCTMGVVAGLHARGLKKLREFLPEME